MNSNAPATRKDIDDVIELITSFVGAVDTRFNTLEGRFDKLEGRFDKLEGRFDKLELQMVQVLERLDVLESEQQALRNDIRSIFDMLDQIAKRQEVNDDERLVMGHQLDRLDRWVHEVANKIGHKLSA